MTPHVDAHAVRSLITEGADPVEGRMVWDPPHSLWNGAMAALALIGGPLTTGWGPVVAFLLLSGATLLLGHSVGFHRRMIHGSFDCPKWLERVLAWFGAAVGMSGPLWMIRSHDMRDWGQRQADCHPYLSNRAGFWTDYWWNLHCRLELARPPAFAPDPAIADDPFHRFLERTWMLQQVPIAVALYLIGGWPMVIWGVPVRVFACVTGHWFVGRLAHTRGPQTWIVETSGIQAHDVPWAAIPTMGEAWHNNHHAFPGSARLGLYPGQADWGYRFIEALEAVGLATNVRTADTLPGRPCLTPAAPDYRAIPVPSR